VVGKLSDNPFYCSLYRALLSDVELLQKDYKDVVQDHVDRLRHFMHLGPQFCIRAYLQLDFNALPVPPPQSPPSLVWMSFLAVTLKAAPDEIQTLLSDILLPPQLFKDLLKLIIIKACPSNFTWTSQTIQVSIFN
jgi:hypothetical protein